PISTGGFAQRLVHRASALLGGGTTTRRSFLTRTAVVGSALAIGPVDFILRPGTAYAYVCGSCGDGWTAFCCTINGGRNSCPTGSFIAGWWKADNAAYCCGAARYIIDCNATCPTQCSCRCAGGSCDNRRTCCNQFRYGQCHQEIACYGPVVCRVATCTVPWRYDPSCTTSSATDNRTVEHGAPCLAVNCGTPISEKYAALGGTSSVLGAPTGEEEAIGDGRGRRRRYQNGNIYWTSATGAREVHGSIFREYDRQNGVVGVMRYPTSDTRTSGDGRTRYSNFEGGRIYSFVSNAATVAIPNPFFYKHESLRGVSGYLGYPVENVRRSGDGLSTYVNFEDGRIYSYGGVVVEIHGSVFDFHESIGGVRSALRYPASDLFPVGDGRGKTQWFQGGILWYTPTTGARGLWGAVLDRYLQNGNARGYLGYPKSSMKSVIDFRGSFAQFEKGDIYASPQTGGHQVHGAVLSYYLARGGPTGSLGYPTTELDPPGTARRYQSFERGRISYANGTVTPA
nr:twin-arginine translocation signal domain-containing protein [Acidimicrobiia bacterium]